MTWLVWRQHRLQLLVAGLLLAAFAAVLATTGPQLVHLERVDGDALLERIDTWDSALYLIGTLGLLATPALLGAFWGVPLVAREIEDGTHRLIWTQSVTRFRWLATKLALIGGAAMVAGGLLSLAVSWWSRPIDLVVDRTASSASPVFFFYPRLTPAMFDARGVVPVAYAAFAVALGVTIGLLIRRLIPAMAVTLAAYIAVLAFVPGWIGRNIMPSRHLTVVITPADMRHFGPGGLRLAVDRPGAWVTSQQTVDGAGHPASAAWVSGCFTSGIPPRPDAACFARYARLGYRQLITYQPANHFWPLQWYEAAIFLALALVLGAFCAWWIRRGVS